MNQNPNNLNNNSNINLNPNNNQMNPGATNPNAGPVNQPQVPVNNASQFIQTTQTSAPVKKKKKGLSKELVTIIGVLAIVAILYFTYNYQLNKNLEIINKVPVAREKIAAGSRITADNIEYIDVPASTLKTVKAVTNAQEIIGKYVNYDTIIPANSFFYSEALSDTDTAPNSIFKDLVEQDTAIMISVNLEKTYGNSIMPGDVVDIYADAVNTNSQGRIEYITGPLITGAKVLAVLDSSGNNMFANHENKLYPSYFVFTLNSEIIKLIRKAQKLSASQYSMELYPVVDGKTYRTDGSTTLVNQSQIVDLIENATVDIRDNN